MANATELISTWNVFVQRDFGIIWQVWIVRKQLPNDLFTQVRVNSDNGPICSIYGAFEECRLKSLLGR